MERRWMTFPRPLFFDTVPLMRLKARSLWPSATLLSILFHLCLLFVADWLIRERRAEYYSPAPRQTERLVARLVPSRVEPSQAPAYRAETPFRAPAPEHKPVAAQPNSHDAVPNPIQNQLEPSASTLPVAAAPAAATVSAIAETLLPLVSAELLTASEGANRGSPLSEPTVAAQSSRLDPLMTSALAFKDYLIGCLIYPSAALRRGISGSVGLAVFMDKNGSIAAAIVRQSSGSRLLDGTAVAAALSASQPFPAPEHDLELIVQVVFAAGTIKLF
ncbi:MAG: hypothetical protein A2004_02110 [Spirochaetes bacterium GWC1_61_12]|nr:MAG: hypothetical protein A2004_02110 [Spirochaetes bacterium GWC1_61_12]